MNVLFISPEYPSIRSGGIGTFFRTLGRCLTRYGHQVKVLIPAPGEDFLDGEIRVTFLQVPRVRKFGWLLLRLVLQREIRQLEKSWGVDVIEAADWCGLTAGVSCHPPVLIRCHGSETYFASLLGRRASVKTYWEERVALRRATSVSAVSRFTAERTRELLGLGATPRVIYNGVDTAYFSPNASGPAKDRTVLYLGTLVRKKGAADLGDIFSKIHARVPDVQFRIVGRDCRDPETGSESMLRLILEQMTPESRARLVYVGELAGEAVREELRRARVCLFPSYAEAFPISWLEAMSCGVPLVTYDSGWAREIFQGEDEGMIVARGNRESMAEAASRLVLDSSLSRKIGEGARRRIERQFTLERCMKETLDWYIDAMRQPRADANELTER